MRSNQEKSGLLPGIQGAADITHLTEIPAKATVLNAKLVAIVQPSVRMWITEQAMKLQKAPIDDGALCAVVQARFVKQSCWPGDVEALVFLVLMQAAKASEEDLKTIMEEIKAKMEAKQKLHELISRRKNSNIFADDLKGKLDEMNEMSEMTSLRLQMIMDRRSKFIQTLSNIMKKISTTQDTLIQNLK